jgi:hypothetical protein
MSFRNLCIEHTPPTADHPSPRRVWPTVAAAGGQMSVPRTWCSAGSAIVLVICWLAPSPPIGLADDDSSSQGAAVWGGLEGQLLGAWTLDLEFIGMVPPLRPRTEATLSCTTSARSNSSRPDLLCELHPRRTDAKWEELLERTFRYSSVPRANRYRVGLRSRTWNRTGVATYDPESYILDAQVPMVDSRFVDRLQIRFSGRDHGEFLLQQTKDGEQINAFVGSISRATTRPPN